MAGSSGGKGGTGRKTEPNSPAAQTVSLFSHNADFFWLRISIAIPENNAFNQIK